MRIRITSNQNDKSSRIKLVQPKPTRLVLHKPKLPVPYFDGTEAPKSYLEVPFEVPYDPVVLLVRRTMLFADFQRSTVIKEITEPIHILYGHGFSINGRWCFRDGTPVAELLAKVNSAPSVAIRGLCICNPGRHYSLGRHFYVFGSPLVSFEYCDPGFALTIRPQAHEENLIKFHIPSGLP